MRVKDVPDNLKPYVFHRLDLDWSEGEKEALADCLFCGRESKLSIDVKSGMYRCFVCEASGNHTTFLKGLWELSVDSTEDYEWLAERRNLLNPETLIHWECCKSVLSNNWMVPGYTADGNISQLYRYAKVENKLRLLATPKMNHAIHGNYSENKSQIFLCEGPWDAMILWELLNNSGELEDISVLATPGCNVFQKTWLPLFADKDVTILFDNDHPREVKGKQIEPAGYAGCRKISRLLTGASNPPASINFLKWGENGYNDELPNNYDLGDFICDA